MRLKAKQRCDLRPAEHGASGEVYWFPPDENRNVPNPVRNHAMSQADNSESQHSNSAFSQHTGHGDSENLHYGRQRYMDENVLSQTYYGEQRQMHDRGTGQTYQQPLENSTQTSHTLQNYHRASGPTPTRGRLSQPEFEFQTRVSLALACVGRSKIIDISFCLMLRKDISLTGNLSLAFSGSEIVSLISRLGLSVSLRETVSSKTVASTVTFMGNTSSAGITNVTHAATMRFEMATELGLGNNQILCIRVREGTARILGPTLQMTHLQHRTPTPILLR